MDDLLKQLGGQKAGAAAGASQGDPLGGLGQLLGGGGLSSMLGGAFGSSGSSGSSGIGGLAALVPALLALLGGQGGSTTSGVQQIVDRMRTSGLGGVADSWIGSGANQAISASQVEQVLGSDKVRQLSADTGLQATQVNEGLATILPELVNHLTPDGKVPDAAGVASAFGSLFGGGGGG